MGRQSDSLWFGNYNTWQDCNLYTTKLEIDPPEVKANYIELDGANGTIDLTEALSERPVYKDRKLKATFWTRNGNRTERESLLQQIINSVHGRKLKIIAPDEPNRFFLGRVTIKNVVRTNVFLQFDAEAVCDPWRYANVETVKTFMVSGEQSVILVNSGVATLCPNITITGTVTFSCNGVTTTASDGSYKIATFKLFEGENTIGLSGSGTLTLTYREATL